MENFSLNSAKSYIGKNVNLHLKDGAVIVNVRLKGIQKANSAKNNQIQYTPFGTQNTRSILLRNIAWAEMLNPNLIQTNHLKCC